MQHIRKDILFFFLICFLFCYFFITPKVSYAKNYISVKEFGAVGDGKTDDTLAIQKALKSGNNIVFEKKKTYLCTSAVFINSSNIKIDK